MLIGLACVNPLPVSETVDPWKKYSLDMDSFTLETLVNCPIQIVRVWEKIAIQQKICRAWKDEILACIFHSQSNIY